MFPFLRQYDWHLLFDMNFNWHKHLSLVNNYKWFWRLFWSDLLNLAPVTYSAHLYLLLNASMPKSQCFNDHNRWLPKMHLFITFESVVGYFCLAMLLRLKRHLSESNGVRFDRQANRCLACGQPWEIPEIRGTRPHFTELMSEAERV